MLAKGYGFIYDQLNRLTTSRYGEGTSYTSNVERYDENLTFKYILTPEGRATYSSGAYTYEYFMKDHLGNTRISFNVPGSTAVIVQQSDYYPYGMTHRPQAVTTSDNRYLFNGKELQNNLLGGVNLDWYDYGARFYDAQIGRFTTQDAYAEKYINLTPYQYGANNPIRYIDINGDSIQAQQAEAQQMITNTLTAEDAKYIQFDENGNINLELLNSHSSESGNYNSLLGLANAETVINVSLDDHFNYVDENGVAGTSEMSYQPAGTMAPDVNGETISGTSTGEAGLTGKTLFPDLNGKQNSPDGTLKIIVNNKLSEAARAEIYSHEANGHAYIYVTTGGDRARASHNVTTGWIEQNNELKVRIIDSKKETIINMRNR